MSNALEVGDVVLVSLPSHQPKGHEQEGRRPAIVVGIPTGVVRYPIILVAPLTTQIGEWVQKNANLYPQLAAGVGGLSQNSVVLLDQIRAVDAERVVSYLGSLTVGQYQPIVEGLQTIFRI